ncbi:DUF2293 domain-containing protein [Pseudonocardia sp. GCM10023141]|uniref:DUF2293 domain-containing protein n=1 Tax=Pseudonocardia sp. GCM10023141 TaxID=3252653 RepID=UPI00361D796A
MPSSPNQRALAAAERFLTDAKAVSALDVLCGLRWINDNHLDHWKHGRTPYLPPLGQVGEEKLRGVLATISDWAAERGLKATEIAYVSAHRDRKPLQFTPDGDADLERLLRTHWVSGDLPPAQQEKAVAKASKPPELLVIMPLKEFTCAVCGGTGDLLVMEDAGALCLTCADLDMLEFLPAGDATLTRRAKKASGLSAVVVRFSRSRKRYERQGILVEEPALRAAEASCLADEEVRLRQRERDRVRRAAGDVELTARMAAEIGSLFPGCPPERARASAEHTAVRGSGRVGRSAAGRELEERALVAAVIASIRHEDTPYDALLMAGVAREDARARIRDDVDAVLATWRAG